MRRPKGALTRDQFYVLLGRAKAGEVIKIYAYNIRTNRMYRRLLKERSKVRVTHRGTEVLRYYNPIGNPVTAYLRDRHIFTNFFHAMAFANKVKAQFRDASWSTAG